LGVSPGEMTESMRPGNVNDDGADGAASDGFGGHSQAYSRPPRPPKGSPRHYKRIEIDGLNVFYREAGDPGAPKVLLLHGFPSSSHQYRNLIPALADRFHVIAPDYPGFGNSDMPDPKTYG